VKVYLETLKKLGRSLNLNENKGYALPVVLTLILVSSIIIGYYAITRLPPEGYTTIYVLDEQKKAADYPELLVLNKNNTFNVWVGVKNHMGKTASFNVSQKVVNMTSSFPVEAEVKSSYVKTLANGETWETLATVSINQPGNYSVIFELWMYNDDLGAWQFTNNYPVLNIEVKDQT
jgi:uncharacterized membrane protein